MKIIIAGMGETGRSLVKLLEGSGHDITVVDRDRSRVDAVTDKFSVNGVCGSGASTQTLKSAGADKADIFIALTHIDEINLLSCMQAKSLGARRCVARIIQPDLVEEKELLKEEYNIDLLINPQEDLADEIYRNIGLPGYVKLQSCIEDEVFILDINAVGKFPLIGKTLREIRDKVSADIKITMINRGKKTFIPKETDEIKADDGLYIVVRKAFLDEALSILGVSRSKSENIVIIGGGITGECLARMLVKDKRKITILDDDLTRCRELMERFPTARVSYAEGDITEVLDEEKIDRSDSVISLTNNDETNLVISMFAWSRGIRSVITRVDKQVHVKLLHKVNIDITVSPTELCVFRALHFIDGQSGQCADEQSKIMEFIEDLKRF